MMQIRVTFLNLTAFVIECIFCGLRDEGTRRKIKQQHFLQLFGLLFVKDRKIESQEYIKEKFDIGVVLWVKHIYHYSTQIQHLKYH